MRRVLQAASTELDDAALQAYCATANDCAAKDANVCLLGVTCDTATHTCKTNATVKPPGTACVTSTCAANCLCGSPKAATAGKCIPP